MGFYGYFSQRFDFTWKVSRGSVVAILVSALALCTVAVSLAQSANVSPNSSWVATWGAAMMATRAGHAPDFSDQTLRQVVHVSAAGTQTRVWFSNRFGTEPLHIGSAHVALRNSADAIDASSDHALTFNGDASVSIPPGATIVSDPVAMQVPAFADLAVSCYFPNHTAGTTQHGLANQTNYRGSGNQTTAASLTDKGKPVESWFFLTGVDVMAPGDSAVVTLGDSITDGARSTPDTNHRWPDDLAVRLAADADAKGAGVLAVTNVGISGNRVLLDGTGPNALARFNRDVLARSGVRDLIVLESINDIARYADHHQTYGDLEQRLETAFAEMATQAHQHGIRIFAATLTPYQGCSCFTAEGEAVRDGLNHWIRTSQVLDGYVDFDKATQDPQHPLQYLPQYDSGDHVHPSDAGYQVMANAIDLRMLAKPVDAQGSEH
ncbi:MAG: SGNH/GDSL hydrolase family protein [Acidobacteriota bacterium]